MISETHKIIISDTSCFIILHNIGELDLLRKMYGTVITTKEIVNEFGNPIPSWVRIMDAGNTHYQKILELQVDRGEASAIALAIEIPGSMIILDDNKARKVAIGLGLEITGTIGVIIKAKLAGLIPSVKPFLDKIQKTNFRISNELIEQAIKASEYFTP